MIEPRLRPGYSALMAARYLARDSGRWTALMNDVLHLPLSMLPAVQRSVNQGAWSHAIDPIASVKANAERYFRRDATRMGKPAVPKGE